MGGHGGLNILPQKKWNVYNWDNRQIVQKDKQEHAARLRRESERDREEGLQRKMEVLKEDSAPTPAGRPEYQQAERPSHSLLNAEMRRMAQDSRPINLFEQEERLLLNKDAEELRRLKEEEFLRGKNMDYSTRFLGSYKESKPWYSQKKGSVKEQPRNKHYKPLQEVIYAAKTDSKVTREVIQSQKRQESTRREESLRDRTRQKFYQKYEECEQKCVRLEKDSRAIKQIMRHEQDILVQEFAKKKEEQIEKLRQKRLKREEKEKLRVEQLKNKNGAL